MITASIVKELRDKTNAGMMDCKKVLTETNGDLEASIKLLRERGIMKAGTKADRAATEGIITARVNSGATSGFLLEVNCETDFVSRNENFQTFVAAIAGKLPVSGRSIMPSDMMLRQGMATDLRPQRSMALPAG